MNELVFRVENIDCGGAQTKGTGRQEERGFRGYGLGGQEERGFRVRFRGTRRERPALR